MPKQRPPTDPFDLRDRRAMVSLGPLSPKKYCTYSCPFCYVNAGFLSYASFELNDIISWLNGKKGQFDIIYVSGDTDSFSPPRTERGIELLELLSQFNVDVLFTTRALFHDAELKRLSRIAQSLAAAAKYLIGCVSICQLHHPHLEPPPIAAPLQRIQQLSSFKEVGIVSVLAMRPFLPVVPVEEYIRLVDLCVPFVDVILGEVWYADQQGILERGVFQGETPADIRFVEHEMDFDINQERWKVFEAEEVEKAVSAYCTLRSIPFFMRSQPAIDWIRANKGAIR